MIFKLQIPSHFNGSYNVNVNKANKKRVRRFKFDSKAVQRGFSYTSHFSHEEDRSGLETGCNAKPHLNFYEDISISSDSLEPVIHHNPLQVPGQQFLMVYIPAKYTTF
jgi:hypothetical protein